MFWEKWEGEKREKDNMTDTTGNEGGGHCKNIEVAAKRTWRFIADLLILTR
jgi:hypothetical protein